MREKGGGEESEYCRSNISVLTSRKATGRMKSEERR